MKRLNTSKTTDESHSLSGHEPEVVNSATSSVGTPFTFEEVARQIRAAADPLTKQLERLSYLMKELSQALPKRNKETTGLVQVPSRPHSSRFNNRNWIFLVHTEIYYRSPLSLASLLTFMKMSKSHLTSIKLTDRLSGSLNRTFSGSSS